MSKYEQLILEGNAIPDYSLNYGRGKNGMDFINLYAGEKQVAFAYLVQRNNSWDVKVKDQALMDKLGFEKAQFAAMASEALFFYSKYAPIKKAYAKARKGDTRETAKLSDLYERAVKYAKEKRIQIEA